MYTKYDVSANRHYICDQMAINLSISCGKTIFVTLLSFGLVGIAPMYKLLFTDDKELPLPILFPFTNLETQFGYCTNLIIQSVFGLFGVLILMGAEIGICMIKFNATISTAIIQNELMKLSNQLEMDDEFKVKHIWKFRNIILQVLDMNRFNLNFL